MEGLKTLTPDELKALSAEVKQALTDLYGDRLERVVLYGSYARGDFHPESDVDFLVVLRDDNFRQSQEFDKLWENTWSLWERFGVWISCKIVSQQTLSASDLFFYRTIRQEGQPL